ncbi:MAG: hypothetical protein WKF73_03325 [Nocardioidaceae bacterium]
MGRERHHVLTPDRLDGPDRATDGASSAGSTEDGSVRVLHGDMLGIGGRLLDLLQSEPLLVLELVVGERRPDCRVRHQLQGSRQLTHRDRQPHRETVGKG